jgi:hypothetical protein
MPSEQLPKRPRWRRIFATAFAVFMFFISIGGIPDSLKNYFVLAQWVGSEIGRWLVAFAALAIVIWANDVVPRLLSLWKTETAEGTSLVQERITSIVPSTPVTAAPFTIIAPVAPVPALPSGSLVYKSTDDVPEADLIKPWLEMVCPRCRRTGLDWGRLEQPCPKCHARGLVSGEYLRYEKCLPCRATGRAYARLEVECSVCDGFGRRKPA